MNFLTKLSRLLSGSSANSDRAYFVEVRCKRCGEQIRARVDLSNDLSLDFGEADGESTTYFCRKVLIGERCFQQIEVQLRFDPQRKLLERQISGGTFADDPIP